jgi:hypothetical protein
VSRVLVDNIALCPARLHHHTPTDGIEGVGNNTGDGCDTLSNSPRDKDGSVLGVRQDTLGCVVEAKEGGTVDDDTLDGDTEAAVETNQTVRFVDFN